MFYEFHIQGVGSRRHPFSGQSGVRCSKSNGWLRVKKNLLMKSPQLLRPCSTTSHVTMRTAAMARSVQWRLLNPKMSNTVCSPPPPPTPSHYRKNAIRFMTFIILHNSVNVMFTFSPMFSFQKKKGKKVKEGIN